MRGSRNIVWWSFTLYYSTARAGHPRYSRQAAGVTLNRISITLCISILSETVGFGTKRTRGPSWYQTLEREGQPVFPAGAERRDWGRPPCSGAAKQSRPRRARASGAD